MNEQLEAQVKKEDEKLDISVLFVEDEELLRAIRALDSLVGRVDVEHLLDEIFASFCVGK